MQMLKVRRRAEESVVTLALDEIVPNPLQPRQVFDGAGLEELAQSIGRHGVL